MTHGSAITSRSGESLIITKERWTLIRGIPGIAAKGDIVIVRPGWGILVTRELPLALYPDLMLYRDALSALPPRQPVPGTDYRGDLTSMD